MKIYYDNKKIEQVCTNDYIARKKYGLQMANKISERINSIELYNTIDDLIHFNIGRCHLLKGNRKGQYAIDLIHPYRLVFEKYNHEISIVSIIEIVDYH